jgi:hypothetical protein
VRNSIHRKQRSETSSLYINMVIRRERDLRRRLYDVFKLDTLDDSPSQIQFNPFAMLARVSPKDQQTDPVLRDDDPRPIPARPGSSPFGNEDRGRNALTCLPSMVNCRMIM